MVLLSLVIPTALFYSFTRRVMPFSTSMFNLLFYQVLYEELKECAYPNKTNPGDTMGAITYVQNLEEHVTGDIEAIHVRTIGTYSL